MTCPRCDVVAVVRVALFFAGEAVAACQEDLGLDYFTAVGGHVADYPRQIWWGT